MVIIGAKGFAKEVLEICYQQQELDNLFFFDNVSTDLPDHLYGRFKIIKNYEQLTAVFKTDNRYILGIGGTILRYKLAEQAKKCGGVLTTLISPFAHIGHFGVTIANGCTIMTGTIITNDVTIKKGVLINLDCTVGHDTTIGNYCELSPSVNISGGCQLGDFCTIGTGAILLPKVKLGTNVTVGAGAVVTKDVDDNALVVGIPAKKVKELNPIIL